MPTIGIVVVSHSVKIAEGVVDLARQMAPTTTIVAAGGADDGSIGTSFDKISAALAEAAKGGGAVVLCDLGSAILTSETAVDFLDDAEKERIVIADAPLVEGTVAAAVTAETGGDLESVAASARTATGVADAHADERDLRGGDAVERSAVLVNASGLHARPAADLVTHASRFQADVTVNGVDAKSLLRIMGLNVGKGSTVAVMATGPDAAAAVDDLITLIEGGFGEKAS
ncbi:dihydroxyacetone kinase phosphoryl donor subunit DhaM [Frigoribacterium sp. VKM Ac-2836]|uniref:dihydroxyacetone kinase phosphoryl donor subunit DhaM n=1 Tax=Frigoribacterium sp. VKM Ac-2836 TaxID=2739014 RepID=UPI001562F15D|nr:dihydroxyacetone kinase phosphoryl donor subunit DhaM [Frigoribacterium sp. VKM Ac-2836]NRD26096.1 PTS-dependent dihydroxyacetone kinase phosphotransferase subunit DhaM [Frigoribacterium sp. VKM Ac-2836]